MTRNIRRGADRILWMDQKTEARSDLRKSGFRKSRLILFIPPMLFLIVSSLFFVWSRIQVIQLGYEISNALKEGRSLVGANKRLRLEIATLKSYARIEKVAVEELKMSKPKPEQVIVIR
jgi:cell division protein FtsL